MFAVPDWNRSRLPLRPLLYALPPVAALLSYRRPGIKAIRVSTVLQYIAAVEALYALHGYRPARGRRVVRSTLAIALSLAIPTTRLLLRYDSSDFEAMTRRCLGATRTPFRRSGSNFVATIAGTERRIRVRSLMRGVAVLDFTGSWQQRKAQVVQRLILKSLEPLVPRIVIRLGGAHAKSEPDG
ncbi:MAG TPA: hypothetical protein VFB34_13800 [Chloroflexota bacterium]|nr:hypothetical protein [Chloroflexota bacterium]